ncbi:MAG: riboflavin synthase [Haloferacaceae archaeon]
MFTGIVEGTGRVTAVRETDGGRRLRIAPGDDLALDDLHAGQSIAVSGVCLTVEAYDPDGAWFEVFTAVETLERTYLGRLDEGAPVNVERALPADGRFDGHLVQGHVDATTTVEGVAAVGDDWWYEFALPDGLERYVVEKGSVALDGISLTVADRGPEAFGVAVVPTTYDLTTLGGKQAGDPVHVEVDVVAKYVESLVEGYREGAPASEPPGEGSR